VTLLERLGTNNSLAPRGLGEERLFCGTDRFGGTHGEKRQGVQTGAVARGEKKPMIWTSAVTGAQKSLE